MKQLSEICTPEDWKPAKKTKGTAKETIIFKFSTSCGTSYFVERLFDNWFNSLPDETNLSVLKINVIKMRHLSQMIANEFKIRHESPQVIWLDKNNTVKWHASHHDISESDLNKQL